MTDSLYFRYSAADPQGQRRSGVVQAANLALAIDVLVAQGLRVFQIDPVLEQGPKQSAALVLGQGWSGLTGSARVSDLQRVWLFDELATLLESGVVLAEAVEGLSAGQEHSAVGAALAHVNMKLRGGVPLSGALTDSGLGLPRYVTELVRAGESTGRLAGSARAAAQQLLAEFEFRREVNSALTYPAVLIGSGLMAMLVVFVFVVPKFATILDNPKADLPLLSLWVLHGGVWLAAHAAWVAAVTLALALATAWAVRQPRVRQWAWEAAAQLPFTGAWVQDAESYRWSSMLALLTQNRVGLLEALAQANATLRGRTMAFRGQQVADAVRQGRALAAALAEHRMLSPSALSLVRVGERSGTLDRSLATLASRYRSASQQRVKRFLVLLEPITILFISVVLGGVMISVILAVTSLTNVIG